MSLTSVSSGLVGQLMNEILNNFAGSNTAF
jgi:hypothetical protein